MRISLSAVRALTLVASFAFVGALGAPAGAADPALSAADRTAIHQVVQGQLDAFQHDDGTKAFSFAAPAIQDVFHTPDIFMSMVKTGYAPVYRSRQVEFGAIETIDGSPVQHVFLVGPDGANVDALYYMEHEGDGNWRIKGCELRQSNSA
jgi:hypothetical protein